MTKTLMEILMEAEQLIRPLPMVVGLERLVYHSCSAAATLNIITAHLCGTILDVYSDTEHFIEHFL